MDQYRPRDAALLSLTDPIVDSGSQDSGRPDEEAVLLDVAANFASEHGVPGTEGRTEDRERSLRRAARQWPLLEDPQPDQTTSEDEVVELLRDAVDARDRFPGLWAAATERGAVGGRELRQLVRQHRDKALTETLRIDADQVVVLQSEPDLWHAVFRASRFLGRLHGHGLTDDQILALIDTHVRDPAIDLRAG